MSVSSPPQSFKLTGWHVLAGFVLFFGVIAAVNTAMVIRAYATYPGEVGTTPYEDGLAYDKILNRETAQAAQGWRVGVQLEGGVISLTVNDRSGAPVDLRRIDAHVERPATLAGSHGLRFVTASPGLYRASAGDLSGAWDLSLSAFDRTGRRLDIERRLIAP